MSLRKAARSESIGSSRPAHSQCQKVQPLQAGRPCTSAPILWIEPTISPTATAPSARTSAWWRRFSSRRIAPGAMRPASIRAAKATRGSLRFAGAAATTASGNGPTSAIRASAAAM